MTDPQPDDVAAPVAGGDAVDGDVSGDVSGDWAFAPPKPASLRIAGQSTAFPVGRVFCIGRNYDAHAREMDSPARAVVFMKPPSAVVPLRDAEDPDPAPASLPRPAATQRLDHEVELVLAIGPHAAPIADDASARAAIFGYGVGVDLTRRDAQFAAKDAGEPWEAAKAFDASAPAGPVIPAARIGHPRSGAIWCDVNGQRRQDGDLADMLLAPEALLIAISATWRLQAGDLVFTGTPAGVGPLNAGDEVRAGVSGVGAIAFRMA